MIRLNQRRVVHSVVIAATTCLAACSEDTPPRVESIASAIRSTDASGNVIFMSLFDEVTAQDLDSDDVGYAYKSGIAGDGTLVALAGLVNTGSIAAPTDTGTAVYRGRSRAIVVRDPINFNIGPSGGYDRSARTASVTIQANLDDGTFIGENSDNAVGGTFSHYFDGRITDGGITGTGRANVGGIDSLDTRLEGRIGNDKAVLVFHGSDSLRAVAGGMTLTRD